MNYKYQPNHVSVEWLWFFPPKSAKTGVSQPWLLIRINQGSVGEGLNDPDVQVIPLSMIYGEETQTSKFSWNSLADSNMLTTALIDYWIFMYIELKDWLLKNIFFN